MTIVRETADALTIALTNGYVTISTVTVPRAAAIGALGAARLCNAGDGWRLYIPETRPADFDLDALTPAEIERIARGRQVPP